MERSLCPACSTFVEGIEECDNDCGTNVYRPCGCEIHHRDDGQSVPGHNSKCGIESEAEMCHKPQTSHKIFVTRGAKSSPSEKNVKEELEELRADREALVLARNEILSLKSSLREAGEHMARDQIQINELKAKLKNIKRLLKLLEGQL